MIQVLNVVYAIAAFAWLLLAGRFLVRAMSLGRHEVNPVYRLLVFLSSPVVGLVRRLTPSRVLDEHLPLVAFLLLSWLCGALAFGLPRLAGVAP